MRTIKILLYLLTSFYGASAQGQAPASPQESPGDWMLAFVDVETTGLVPGYHEMIDIGIVMSDLEGAEQDSLFIRIQPAYPERTQEGARAVNAFDEAKWKEVGALPVTDAVDRIVAFHHAVAGEKRVLMVAFNSHFDATFLDHLFRASDRSWRELYYYVMLDLPSMAWSLGYRGLTGQSLAEVLDVEDEPRIAEQHTGITGAQLNARLYRALIR